MNTLNEKGKSESPEKSVLSEEGLSGIRVFHKITEERIQTYCPAGTPICFAETTSEALLKLDPIELF